MTDILAEPVDRLLAAHNSPQALRGLLKGASLDQLRADLAQLGYDDALVDESAGGLGLRLSDLTAMLITLGRRLCPLPLGHNIVARALLARSGLMGDVAHVVLLTPVVAADGRISAPATPLALGASHALLDLGARQALVPIASAQVHSCAEGLSLAADLEWARLPQDAQLLEPSGGSLRATAAALGAATIAGLIAGAVDLTTEHAATRRQFGKPLADFQAIQQQLAVLAEEAAAAAMAAAIGCMGPGPLADPMAAAVAKMRTSLAATRAAAIAHAVHGAIGFSEEYDLQLFTRRLAEERLANGGELYWAEQIGRSRLADPAASSVAYVRQALEQAAQ